MQSRLTFENGHLQLRKPSQDELNAASQESTEAPKPYSPVNSPAQSEGTAWEILLQKCKPAPKVPQEPWQPPAGSKCYLMTIPPEIRLKIYHYLLISRQCALLHKRKEEFRLVAKNPWDCPLNIYPQILRTCKQINQEATPILYSRNLFRRGYEWPHQYTDSGTRIRWPVSDTSLISQANLASISRIHLFRDYSKWLQDGKLAVLDEFPHLKELHIYVDFNDGLEMEGGSFESFTKDTIKAIHRERPDIPCFEMEIRLPFHGRDYDNWAREYTRGKESFSYHLTKKAEMEAWMQRQGLFSNRFFSWSFNTMRSEYCGPSFLLGLAALSAAVSLSDIPSCAMPCILQALNATGTADQNIRSICNDAKFQTRVTNCVLGVCSMDEIKGIVPNLDQAVVWATVAFNAISALVLLILGLTIGRNVTFLLESDSVNVLDMNNFVTSNTIILAHCAVNLALDVWMLILPMTQLYNVGLKLKKKIIVMAMFGLGVFLTVASLVRLYFQAQFLANPSSAETGQLEVVLWACIETYMGAIVACVPSLRHLVQSIVNRMESTKQGRSSAIFVDRSLARIPDEEDMPTLSDTGGLTAVTVSSGTETSIGTDNEMEILPKREK
ncbi:hypothetical protein F53441_10665 [Fusarium austroafricanum]|uniref:F-box domain-containing protein n=1 Tax=Fusarium austroafricanum TaxID=2364996 RepID=A0A8H4K8Y1_9HYPO|nr:hypothetical protein F53441_10665 [Fusarium austroafricanum]